MRRGSRRGAGTAARVRESALAYSVSSSAGAEHELWATLSDGPMDAVYKRIYALDVLARVDLINHGVPAALLPRIAESMELSKDALYALVGFPRATIDRKVKDQKLLNVSESELTVGLARLVGQVERIVTESGGPSNFSAPKWVADWIALPHSAFGERRPADLMTTGEGRQLVESIVAQMQSGAYA